MSKSEEIAILGLVASEGKEAVFSEMREKFRGIFESLSEDDKAVMALAAQFELLRYVESN